MGAAIEVIPGYLLEPERKDDLIIFLQRLPVPPRRKKEVFLEWAKYVGAVYTREDIEKLLGPLARYV